MNRDREPTFVLIANPERVEALVASTTRTLLSMDRAHPNDHRPERGEQLEAQIQARADARRIVRGVIDILSGPEPGEPETTDVYATLDRNVRPVTEVAAGSGDTIGAAAGANNADWEVARLERLAGGYHCETCANSIGEFCR